MASDIVRPKDLRGRTLEELEEFVREKKEELFKLRFQHFTGQLENVAKMKHTRREIARALTILDQKRTGQEPPLKSVEAEAVTEAEAVAEAEA